MLKGKVDGTKTPTKFVCVSLLAVTCRARFHLPVILFPSTLGLSQLDHVLRPRALPEISLQRIHVSRGISWLDPAAGAAKLNSGPNVSRTSVETVNGHLTNDAGQHFRFAFT